MGFYCHCRNRSAWELPRNSFDAVCFPGLFYKICGRHQSFWWYHWYPRFGLGFKARVDPCLHVSLPACNEFLRFTFGATPADLLVASMADEPFLIHVLAHVFRSWPWSMGTRRNGSLTLTWMALTTKTQCIYNVSEEIDKFDHSHRILSRFHIQPPWINFSHVLLRSRGTSRAGSWRYIKTFITNNYSHWRTS